MKSNYFYYFTLIMIFILSCNNQNDTVITSVYEDEGGRAIYYDTDTAKGILFISDNFYFYTILDKTIDNTWILIEQAPVFAEEGRVETELQLYNIPDKKRVFPEDIDPSWSLYGSTFAEENGKNSLMIAIKNGSDQVSVPLNELLEKAKNTVHIYKEEEASEEPVKETPPGNITEDIIYIEFGTGENQIGQGMAEKKLEGGRSIDAVPSIAAYNNQIFIIDAINFRVLVYDYSGNFVKSISYPEHTEDGSLNVVRDICADEGVLFLAAVYSNVIYIEDSETEDIIEIIDGSDTEKGKFGYVDFITLDHEKNLVIADLEYNIYYVYKRDTGGISLLRSASYSSNNELIFDNEGNNYSIITEGREATLFDSGGNIVTSFEYKSPSGFSNVLDVDDYSEIFVLTKEAEAPGAQYNTASFVKVIQEDGTMLGDVPVPDWPGGPMTKHIVVDEAGNIFTGVFDFKGSEEEPPAGFVISKVY